MQIRFDLNACSFHQAERKTILRICVACLHVMELFDSISLKNSRFYCISPCDISWGMQEVYIYSKEHEQPGQVVATSENIRKFIWY